MKNLTFKKIKDKKDNKDKLARMNEAWKKEKPILEKREQIRKERDKILAERKCITTTKKLVVYLFLVATIIEIFSGYIMWAQVQLVSQGMLSCIDTAPQVTLISAIACKLITFGFYAYKSMRENTTGGINYMKAQSELNFDEMDSCSVG